MAKKIQSSPELEATMALAQDIMRIFREKLSVPINAYAAVCIVKASLEEEFECSMVDGGEELKQRMRNQN